MMNRKQIVLGVITLLVGYLLLPVMFSNNYYILSSLIAALTIGGIATAWSLLSNLGGMMSFGHAGFFGVGAYASAILSMQYGVPIFMAILLAAAFTAFISIAMMPALKLSGPYFALSILAYAHIFRIIATEWRGMTGGAGGITGIPPLPTIFGIDFSSNVMSYLLILTIVTAFVGIYYLISKSHYGLALKAMGESETATRVVGVNSLWLKAMMLLVSAFMTGMIGAFSAHYINYLEPMFAFNADWTLIPIIAAICGGYRTLTGPVVGAVIIYLLDQLVFKNMIQTGHQILLGALLIIMIIYRPSGIVGLIFKKRRGVKHA